ncbi:DNA topoisomerase I [Ignicoccus hospitalis]|uniref:DNA topoisomerase 1 n=1 Tax=Ignicoccus hospitalis (strain KIN4/I / DSM 18386 / JCM 14125) TaxID=453591 RepID=A8A8D9_IGNH4|nr:DNA topoisomerase I [Ignicoccus hospitalis]ABU81191.1 DNA topoisomerase I [Ignicoccus hospitalis KIN4/I]HIH90621.1 DNA topoisomerase I [Desulfurococcaceae archaeon]
MKGHILVIAEKPKAAEKIANALGKPIVKRKYGVPYWELTNGKKIVVVPAAGHLFGLAPLGKGFPVFDYEWRPLYEIEKGASHTKKYIALISSLSPGSSLYVNACDYDVEGSVIGYIIIERFGDPRRSKRMVFHALTPDEIRRAWNSLRPLDWEMINAGLARHELDWIWGINVSRALMHAYRVATGKSKSLSAGRVQSPTLKEVVERELAVQCFVPEPYFSVSLSAKGVSLEPTLKFETKDEADHFISNCLGKVVDVIVNDERLSPPHPFNLPDLQMEAARLYGFSPSKTQSIAEELYLDAYISYPRTNSQKYPKDLDYANILKGIASVPQYRPLTKALFKETRGRFSPNNGPKDDPAHPAIYPTGKPPKNLSPDHMKVYDLIVRRFMATLASESVYEVTKVVIEVNGQTFKAVGRRVKWKGWTLYYPFSAPQEKSLPSFTKGESLQVKCTRRLQYTKPPERYTKAKIVKWMERVGIGTEATRARIVETLFKRGYLKNVGSKVYATDLGIGVALVLSKFFPEIVSVELTRRFEEDMKKIMMGVERKEKIVEEAKKFMRMILAKYKPHMREVGEYLAYSLGEMEPPGRCAVCWRVAEEDGLCVVHKRARDELYAKYPVWRRRLGLSFEEYLKKVTTLKQAGTAAKEVAKALLSEPTFKG